MIEVEIEDSAWTTALPTAGEVANRAAKAALASGANDRSGLTILLTDDEAVRDLNARFRGKNAATNVLSFPAPETAYPHLGDIALAFGVCAREAAEQGKALDQHLSHLVAHGVLHLLGYDHEDDAEAEAMETIERSLMASLGVPDPYTEAQPALERHVRS